MYVCFVLFFSQSWDKKCSFSTSSVCGFLFRGPVKQHFFIEIKTKRVQLAGDKESSLLNRVVNLYDLSGEHCGSCEYWWPVTLTCGQHILSPPDTVLTPCDHNIGTQADLPQDAVLKHVTLTCGQSTFPNHKTLCCSNSGAVPDRLACDVQERSHCCISSFQLSGLFLSYPWGHHCWWISRQIQVGSDINLSTNNWPAWCVCACVGMLCIHACAHAYMLVCTYDCECSCAFKQLIRDDIFPSIDGIPSIQKL